MDPEGTNTPSQRARRSRLFQAEPERLLIDEWVPVIVLPPPPTTPLQDEPEEPAEEDKPASLRPGAVPDEGRVGPVRIYVGAGTRQGAPAPASEEPSAGDEEITSPDASELELDASEEGPPGLEDDAPLKPGAPPPALVLPPSALAGAASQPVVLPSPAISPSAARPAAPATAPATATAAAPATATAAATAVTPPVEGGPEGKASETKPTSARPSEPPPLRIRGLPPPEEGARRPLTPIPPPEPFRPKPKAPAPNWPSRPQVLDPRPPSQRNEPAGPRNAGGMQTPTGPDLVLVVVGFIVILFLVLLIVLASD